MPTIVTLAYLTGLIGFVCPPLWLITIACFVVMVRRGRRIHAEQHRIAELARHKAYLQWSK